MSECPICLGPKLLSEDECALCRAPIVETPRQWVLKASSQTGEWGVTQWFEPANLTDGERVQVIEQSAVDAAIRRMEFYELRALHLIKALENIADPPYMQIDQEKFRAQRIAKEALAEFSAARLKPL